MTKSILVTGSTAIDQTGIYAGSFADYESHYEVQAFNMSLQLSDIRTSFGGCAPNIAYGLNQLGIEPIALSSAGRNFRDQYEAHLHSEGIRTDAIFVDDEVDHCATCMMINDQAGNQMIGFYPGPPNPKRLLPEQVNGIESVSFAMLGPEAPELTLRQAANLASLEIPMLFDPGQVSTAYSGEEILTMLSYVDTLIINDYEHGVLQENTGLSDMELLQRVDRIIVTRGKDGVDAYDGHHAIHVKAVKVSAPRDVTGCGDAFRAGYGYGLLNNRSMEECVQLGTVMASINLAAPFTQCYKTTPEEVESLRQLHYG